MRHTLARLFTVALVCCTLLAASFVRAEMLRPDSGVSVTVPDGWERAGGGFASANAEVTRIFDCTAEDPGQIKTLGWKTESDGKVTAAFCISYQKSGIGKVRSLLKNSKDKEREAVAAKFLDSFAGKLKSEYAKRKMKVADLSADLLEVGEGFVVVMDGKIVDGATTLLNSSTVYLQGDALLRVSFVYNESTPASVVEQLDAIPLSVNWK